MKIILGDNSSYPVKGLGSIKFDLEYEELVVLHEVMYVLKLKKNLISISTLEEKWLGVALIKGKFLT